MAGGPIRGIVFPGALRTKGTFVAEGSAGADLGDGATVGKRKRRRFPGKRRERGIVCPGAWGPEGASVAERSARAATGRRRKRRGRRRWTGIGRSRGVVFMGIRSGRRKRRGGRQRAGCGSRLVETVWGWVAPFQNTFVGKVGNGFRGGAEDGRGVGPTHGESNRKGDQLRLVGFGRESHAELEDIRGSNANAVFMRMR